MYLHTFEKYNVNYLTETIRHIQLRRHPASADNTIAWEKNKYIVKIDEIL